MKRPPEEAYIVISQLTRLRDALVILRDVCFLENKKEEELKSMCGKIYTWIQEYEKEID
jgi:hypothetical protein